MISPGLRYNAENVRYHATPFGPGDGVTTTFGLLDRHGNPISSGKLKRVDAIHRTDWQGRQLLYATARTNAATQSEFANGVTDAPVRGGLVTAASLGWLGHFTTGLAFGWDGTTNSFAYKSIVYASLTTYTFSIFVKMDDGGIPVPGPNTSSAYDFLLTVASFTQPSGYTITPMTGGIYRVSVTYTTVASPTNNTGVVKYATQSARTFAVSGYDLKVSSALTPYIKTGASAVTVTDYTLTGPSVALGQVPVVGAVLDWDGMAQR